MFDYISKVPKDTKLYIIGYNNSKFDNFLMMNEMFKYVDNYKEFESNVLIANNSILKMNIGRHEVFDLCRFTMCSLKEACKDFDTTPKKIDGFDHNIVQKKYEEGKLKEYLDSIKEQFELYQKNDVYALISLFQKCRKATLHLTGFEITEFCTIAQLAEKFYFKVNYDENSKSYKSLPWHPKSVKDITNMRKAGFGGRNECRKPGIIINKPLRMVDVKSLYPYVMSEGGYKYPVGDYIEVDKYQGKTLLGIYNCNVLKQPEIKVVPLRTDTFSLDWTYDKPINDMWLTTVDIDVILNNGGEVEIKNGYVWLETRDDLFKDFITPFMNEKNNQDILRKKKESSYNSSLRAMCKLFMNSLSGKFLQRYFTDKVKICYTTKDYFKFIEKLDTDSINSVRIGNGFNLVSGESVEPFNQDKAKAVYIGCFIYSYARKYMYENIWSKLDYEYSDTDSALLSEKEFNKIPKELFGDKFGCLEQELNTTVNHNAILNEKKDYCIMHITDDENIKNKDKIKMKGISKLSTYNTKDNHDKYVEELKDKGIEFNSRHIRELTMTGNKTCDWDFFEARQRGIPLVVYNSFLKRHINYNEDNTNVFAIKQVFNLKYIEPIEKIEKK